MELLFSVDEGYSGDKPSIVHTNFKTHYAAINRNMAWATLEPFVRQATVSHILPYIDRQLYDAMLTELDGSPSAGFLELIEQLRDALAHYTVADALPHLNVVISDMGVQESNSGDTSFPVSQWRYKTIATNLLRKADLFMDQVLRDIEELAEGGEAVFSDWKETAAYKSGVTGLFETTRDFQEHININNSRRAYLALVPHIRRAEKWAVADLVGNDFYVEMITNLENDDLSDEEDKLIKMLRNFAAWSALNNALPELAVLIEPHGIQVVSDTDGMQTKKSASDAQLLRLQQQCKAEMYRGQSEIIRYLYAEVDEFPTWKDSDAYIAPVEDDQAAQEPTPDSTTGGIAM